MNIFLSQNLWGGVGGGEGVGWGGERGVDVKVELGLSNYTHNYIDLKTFQYYVAAAGLTDNKQK